jgi:hypothetical protein
LHYQIIEGIEEYLVERQLELKPEKKARLIALLYEHFSETLREVNQDTIVSYGLCGKAWVHRLQPGSGCRKAERSRERGKAVYSCIGAL